MPKISVIVPNFNHSSFLNKRIESILAQTYQDFELIILDDCSTDNSSLIIEKYKRHPKVNQIVYNKVNGGSPFKQWAKGILLAKGEYIWIAESDDFAENTFLEICLKMLEANNNLGFVYTDSNIITEQKKTGSFKIKKAEKYHSDKWDNAYQINGIEELKHSLIKTCTINNVSAVLFRKKAIENVIAKTYDYKYAGDWLCYMLICTKHSIAYIPDALNNYRSHSNNLTKKSDNNYLGMRERIKARNMCMHHISDTEASLKRTANILNWKEFRAIFGGFIRGRIKVSDFFNTLILCFS
ncbi:glycosyltransferase family 2 protein [Pedobacter cryophilus]|uniref:Glycosyltransferase n=1 Tax=Pedobacter cryophilus TaxID=2571271 RepID=A0A4V5NZU5_9SPHI|nr:glycosyltransferase [Pedobacter cryophilus]TKB98623.1 glycosyltransferase [Pedobacter cryophilus]